MIERMAAAAIAATLSGGPMLWTAPGPVDVQPIDAIACPSASLCVAVDRSGGVLWSTDPAGGPRRWRRAVIDAVNQLTGVSCPSTTLCVAVDAVGNALTTTDPTGGASAWTPAPIDRSATQPNTDTSGSVLLSGLACPSTTLCVAVDAAGNAVTSANPTGGAGAWATTHIDTNTSFGCSGSGLTCQPPLVGVACPSAAQCVAVDFSGNVLSTNAPAAPVPWVSAPTAAGGLGSLWGISCPTSTFCATVDGVGGHVITFSPAAPATQASHPLPYLLSGIWCQSQSLCLASAQTDGGISGLAGATAPGALSAPWSFSNVGAVNAVACPAGTPLCLAADGEGGISAGATSTSLIAALQQELLGRSVLPTITRLQRKRRASFSVTATIPGRVTLSWTEPASAAAPAVTVATATRSFTAPGSGRLTLKLTAAGRRLVAQSQGPLTLTATATFAAATGSVSVPQTLTLQP